MKSFACILFFVYSHLSQQVILPTSTAVCTRVRLAKGRCIFLAGSGPIEIVPQISLGNVSPESADWINVCLLACLIACLLACLLVWLIARLLACLLVCLLACLLVCLLVCLLDCLRVSENHSIFIGSSCVLSLPYIHHDCMAIIRNRLWSISAIIYNNNHLEMLHVHARADQYNYISLLVWS